MKIKKLTFTKEDLSEFGLKEFECSKFNTIIALVGKNGSGKTRFLKAIEKIISNCNFRDILEDNFEFTPKSIISNAKSIKRYSEYVSSQEKLKQLQSDSKKNLKNKVIIQQIRSLETRIRSIIQRNNINQKVIQRIDNVNKSIKKEISLRLKVIKLEDFRALKASIDINKNSDITFQDIIDSTQENIEIDEFSMISDSALSYLKRLPNMLAYDDLDTRGDEKKFMNRVAYKRYLILRDFIHELLGKTLEWQAKKSNLENLDEHLIIKTSGYWTLDGRELNYSEFSNGEKVLFTYALLLFLLSINPRIRFKESIIILDEPELNLHPKAQVKLIESLKELIQDQGQLIIATHSLSILANLDYESIFLVRDNEIIPPSSSVPFDSIDELMGFDEHYYKLIEFLVSTPTWAMINFMAQCFDNPVVFEHASASDPQLELFKKLIQTSDKLKILDFGSGKGRLIDRIKESTITWERITSYECFDIETNYNDIVKSKGANVIYNELKKIPAKNYDLIVLVNVLHEINIKDWVKSCNAIKRSLKPNGFLAIIEDTQLPIGELPNDHGFLILGKNEMIKLFGNNMKFLAPDIEKYQNRIVCGIIQSNSLKLLNKNHIISTLKLLKSNSLNSIIQYRKTKQKDVKFGRLYGLKANLYVNSELAIKDLATKNNEKPN